MDTAELPKPGITPFLGAISALLLVCAVAVPAFALPTAPISSLRVAHVASLSAAKYNRKAPLAGAQFVQEGDEGQANYKEDQGRGYYWRGYEVQPYYFNGEEASHVRHEPENCKYSNQAEQTGGQSDGIQDSNPGGDQGYAPDSD